MNESDPNARSGAVNTAKIQAVVDYLPGITIAGAEPALLEWTADDRIRLFKMDFDTNQATEVLFDVPVSEVTNVSGSVAMLVLTVGGKKYRAQFNRNAVGLLGIGGVAGVALAAQNAQATDAQTWVASFKAAGTQMKGFYSYAKIFALALIIVLVIVIIVAAVAVIGTL